MLGGEEAWVDKADMVGLRDAPSFYTKLIRSDRENTWAWYNRAHAWWDLGEFDNALKDFDECIRLSPDDEVAYSSRGMTWMAKKEYDRAIKDFTEAIRLKPDIPFPYCYRGNCFQIKRNLDKALADYAEAIRVDPDFVSAIIDRGTLWHFKKEYAKAIQEYDQAHRIDAQSFYAQANKAYLLATCKDDALRDGKKALTLAKEACELAHWKDGWCLSALAAAYAELGQFDEAVTYERKGQADADYHKQVYDVEAFEKAPQRLQSYLSKKAWRD